MGTVKKDCRQIAPIAAICLVNVLALIGGIAPSLATDPPDIVVIVTDDMRADDWRILDDTQRLVGGTWFDNFTYNTPLCCPTRATIQRGQMAHNTGIKTNEDGRKFVALDDDTIATALDDAGYHTVLVGKYLNLYKERAPGWDVWDIDQSSDEKYWIGNEYATDVIRDWAVDEIAAAPADSPLFLYVAFRTPHNPAEPAPRHKDTDVDPTLNRDDRKRKRALLSVDEAMVAISDAMGPRWDRACVMVLSDNGFLLGEHGTTGKSHWWNEVTRVPLLIRCPGITPGTDERLAATVDIAPTILRAGQASVAHSLDGRPLQDEWDREGVLIESWDPRNDGHARLPFFGIKGINWVYVEPEGESPSYFRLPAESSNTIDLLSVNEQHRLSKWLAQLKACQGTDCG